jgi:hypothetical protein
MTTDTTLPTNLHAIGHSFDEVTKQQSDAELSLTAGTLTIAAINPETKAKTLILETPVSSIEKVVGALVTLHFFVAGKRYSFQFTTRYGSQPHIISDQIVGEIEKDSGITEWVAALKAQGVAVQFTGRSQTRKWAAVAVAIILIIVIVALIVK